MQKRLAAPSEARVEAALRHQGKEQAKEKAKEEAWTPPSWLTHNTNCGAGRNRALKLAEVRCACHLTTPAHS
jgi:hypothetical protein